MIAIRIVVPLVSYRVQGEQFKVPLESTSDRRGTHKFTTPFFSLDMKDTVATASALTASWNDDPVPTTAVKMLPKEIRTTLVLDACFLKQALTPFLLFSLRLGCLISS